MTPIQDDRSVLKRTSCTHCGEACDIDNVVYDSKNFCCEGCKTVYILLNEKGLGKYYNIDDLPGITFKNKRQKDYEFLENKEIIDLLTDYNINNVSKLTFQIPSIHCSSCIWLLENLHQLQQGIISCRVNFLKKKATIQFDNQSINLRQVVELLAKIGYEPDLSMVNLDRGKTEEQDRSLLFKIGVAGFCFGNIMLLSFPDYLGIVDTFFHRFISAFMLGLSLPVLLYSGNDYLKSAWQSLNNRQLSIDVPVALGILTLFLRSTYEIISGTGAGYLDSLSGFVFFLLVGRWFQNYTHESLAFDRNYKSYFPISTYVRSGQDWIIKTLDKINLGDQLLIKNQEVIPCDGILMDGQGRIDYSFVTGESERVRVDTGEKIFAGGRQNGSSLIIEVKKKTDQSYLTELWNSEAFTKPEESQTSILINIISKYFTITIVTIAIVTLWYWWGVDRHSAFNAFTAVLIIACPCVLALSIPFLYGNAIRILGHSGAYFKNVSVLEKLQDIDMLIFDKTGTITDNAKRQVTWHGDDLTFRNQQFIRSLCLHSSHPLSKSIVAHLHVPVLDVTGYKEIEGQGLIGKIGETIIKIGSSNFILNSTWHKKNQHVLVEISGRMIGYFTFKNEIRTGLNKMIYGLHSELKMSLLSGDNNHDEERMKDLFGRDAVLLFDQSPKDKLNYVKSCQDKGLKVMMVGDGLNDAGALKQSDIGLVIADDINNFTPASDIIMDAKTLKEFDDLLSYAFYLKIALYGAFALAVLYNTIGLYFAVTAQLSPIVAAILMPISSISIIIYGVIASKLIAQVIFKDKG